MSSPEKGEEETVEFNRQPFVRTNMTRILLPLIFILWIKTALGSKDTLIISEPIGTVVWNPCQGPADLPGSECGYIM